MTTETILHGYRIIIVPLRPDGLPPLVVIRAPGLEHGDIWTVVELEHRKRMAERRLEVLTAALQIAAESMEREKQCHA
jgi:hypothetical protein